MSVYQDKRTKVWYVSIYHNRQRIREKSPKNTKGAAQEFEAYLRGKLARGESLEEQKIPKLEIPKFKDFSKKWMDTYVINNNKPSEQRQKEMILRVHLVPFFGKIRLDKINSQLIEEYKAKKHKRGLTKKTVNNHLAVLAKCLHVAEDWIKLKDVPVIKLFKLPPQGFDFISVKESELLLENAGRWHDMILVAIKTGLRLGELIGLEWGDINFNNSTITVKRTVAKDSIGSPKSNKERFVPLTKELLFVLKNRLQHNKNGKLVFSAEKGIYLKQERCRRSLHRICKRIGLRVIGWHTLRHSFASHVIERNGSLKALQELLGHSDIKTTMRYAHLAPSALKNTTDLLESDKFFADFGQPVVSESKNPLKKVGFKKLDNSSKVANLTLKSDANQS